MSEQETLQAILDLLEYHMSFQGFGLGLGLGITTAGGLDASPSLA